MSGEVTRSRQKKATAAKNQKQNNQAANLKYAAKKKSKERQKMLEKQSQGSSCFSSLTFWTLFALIGLSYGAYQTNPDNFKEVFNQLPPQVKSFKCSSQLSMSINLTFTFVTFADNSTRFFQYKF